MDGVMLNNEDGLGTESGARECHLSAEEFDAMVKACENRLGVPLAEIHAGNVARAVDHWIKVEMRRRFGTSVSPFVRQKAIELQKAGMSFRQIAKQLNIGVATAHSIVKAAQATARAK